MSRRPDIGYFEENLDLLDVTTWQNAVLPIEQADPINPLVYESLTFSLLENEAIWTRDWIFIGTVDDIPDAGDLLPYTIGNHGIHVQRMPDGSIEGRFNNAQHGGCRVVPLQCQSGSKTKCSFTSCGYSRDRDAIPAADGETANALMYQYLGLRPERLLRVSVAQVGTLIFVNLDGPDKQFSAFSTNDNCDQALRFSGARTAKQWLEFQCNWKLFAESVFENASQARMDSDNVLSAVVDIGVQEDTIVPARAKWFFPNLLILSTENSNCVMGMQPTALGKSYCRFQTYANQSGETGTGDHQLFAQFAAKIGAQAQERQLRVRKTGSEQSAGAGASDAGKLLSPPEYWTQKVLIDRLMTMPRTIAEDPMYQPLRNYLI